LLSFFWKNAGFIHPTFKRFKQKLSLSGESTYDCNSLLKVYLHLANISITISRLLEVCLHLSFVFWKKCGVENWTQTKFRCLFSQAASIIIFYSRKKSAFVIVIAIYWLEKLTCLPRYGNFFMIHTSGPQLFKIIWAKFITVSSQNYTKNLYRYTDAGFKSSISRLIVKCSSNNAKAAHLLVLAYCTIW